jgi:hypothetical protein
MTAATYPNGIFSWGPDRQDDIDVDFAINLNELAAEVASVETIIGPNPQVEPNPIMGSPVTYNTVSNRLSDLLAHTQFPVVSLGNDEMFVPNGLGAGTFFGQWNTYTTNYDPFGLYDGSSVTIPVTGWYFVSIGQDWDWFSTGYHRCAFYCGNLRFREHRWDWDFPGNYNGGFWGGEILSRPGHNNIDWQGVLTAGTRLRVLSENGCADTPHRAYNMDFKLSFGRVVPDGTQAG